MAGRDLDWRAGEGVVLRTPLLPLTLLAEWAAAPDPRAFLANTLALPEVNEALYVASPGLHKTLDAWRANPERAASIEHSLVKYVARMAGRATPFGLFSGVSAGTLGRETRIELAPRAEYRRRTRLDNDYLFVLASELMRDANVRERVLVRPNTSLYRIGDRLRFAAARVEGKDRSYHLVSVVLTPYLEATLARAATGARIADLATALVDDEITLDEARAFVDEIVEAQLLVPDLGVFVTGPEPIDGMIAQLATAGIDTTQLAGVRSAIAAIDAAGLGNAPERYSAIATSLEALPAKVDLALLFQVDMLKPASVAIGNRVASDLAKAFALLARITRAAEGQSLQDFRRAFSDRWEDQEVPLAVVLDEESGIGFESARGPGSEGAPLLAKLGFPAGPGDNRITMRAIDRFLLRRLHAAIASGADEIAIDAADLEPFATTEPARLPDAFSVMTRIAGTPEELARGELAVFFEGTSGPSGARILGRFCHLSSEIDAMVRAHHASEEALRPDAVFAEIVHLNEGRIGNILCRPVLRAHELVFLGVSGAPADRQIHLDDLLVSVRGDRIVLRSRRLGREVIPRLSTAHNFRLRSLGVYRFLCSLATQGCDHVGWSWGPLGASPFLPRVRIGRVVLSRATWNLDEKDLVAVTAAVREAARIKPPKGSKDIPADALATARANIASAVTTLRARHRLPRFLVIAAGDNELPIDLDNPLLAAAFADEVAGQSSVTLHEMFPTPDRLVAHGPEGHFANELVLTFTKNRPPTPALLPRQPVQARRTFAPGSEWLYAKIYCGESTIDHVLQQLAPTIRDSGAAQWFFLRYADPDSHLRLRFAGDPGQLAGSLVPRLERAVAPLIASGVVRKLVFDTYQRELERYGDASIDVVERIFHYDSEAVLGIVELLDGDAGADARWRLAVRGIESLLAAVGLDADQRAAVVTNGREMLGRELHADTAFWGRIGDRFAKERASLDHLFVPDDRDKDHDLEPGFTLLAQRDAKIAGLDLRGLPVAEVAWSLVHMHANRLLHASQRAQELVLYDFLRRLHQSRKARAKK